MPLLQRPDRDSRLAPGLTGALLLLLALAPAVAAEAPPAHEHYVARVRDAEASAYHDVLAEFDAELAAHPGDAPAAVEKCRFIEVFADADDATIGSAGQDLEECRAALADAALRAAEDVRLYLYESDADGAGIEAGEALLKQATAESWTAAHRAALHERLAALYRERADLRLDAKAGAHAVAAVRLNPASRERLAAAEYLAHTGAARPAIALLTPATPVTWSAWELPRAAKLLVELGQLELARELIERRDPAVPLGQSVRLVLANVLARGGQVAAARRVLDEAPAAGARAARPTLEQLRDRLRFESDFGDAARAEVAYGALRARGLAADPWGRYRLGLLARYPSIPFEFGDIGGIAAFALIVFAFALAPLAVIAPIHYRGVVLALRRGTRPEPGPWTLGHLWYALAVTFVASIVGMYVCGYPELESLLDPGQSGVAAGAVSSSDWGQMLVLTNLLMLAGLAPLLFAPAQRAAFRGDWSLKRSLLVGAGSAVLLLIAVALVATPLHLVGAASTGALGSATTQSLQGLYQDFGIGLAASVVCVSVPLAEELVFRGVFLRAAGRHVAFWTAAVAQAVVFAALHEEPATYIMVFALGLVAAWLARRSGGLIAPLALHATNNAFAFLAVIGTTRMLNL